MRHIYLLLLPGVHIMDLAAPAQIFVHEELAQQVSLHYVGLDRQTQSHQGLMLANLEPLPTEVPADSWLILIGTSSAPKHLHEEYYLAAATWLRAHHALFSQKIAICSGALLAAKAGLLVQRHCTTHHILLADLKRIEPQALVRENCIYARDADIWTSAGITTGIDLCLHIVATFYGYGKSVRIARDLVVFQRRNGNAAQLSFWLEYRNHLHHRIHQVQDLIMQQPEQAWRIPKLAERVHLSERHLSRLFKQETGIALKQWLLLARFEYSRQLVEQTDLPLSEIALRCGFSSDRALRSLWQSQLEESAADYRRKVQGDYRAALAR